MRFEEREDCYFDIRTNIEWSKEDSCLTNWCDVVKATKDGLWRLPFINELNSIVDHKLYAPATELPGIGNSSYWSLTVYSHDKEFAWFVNMSTGHSSYSRKDTLCVVRLVKGETEGCN